MTGEANVCLVQPNDEQQIVTVEDDDDDDSHLSAVTSFLDGFIACAHQTIRYLIEVEGLPSDHPIVTGIEDHLYMKIQEAMQLINLMSVVTEGDTDSEIDIEQCAQTDCIDSIEIDTNVTRTDSDYNSSMDDCADIECDTSNNECNLVNECKNDVKS